MDEVALTLRREIRACTRCPLHAQCSGPVPPEIVPDSNILVIGEGPGRREDRTVQPFSGPSGQQLRRWLAEAGLGATRAKFGLPGASQPHPEPRPVSFANAVCCWPVRNPPTPTTEEMHACWPNLSATLRLVDPRYVLLVGNVALNTFLPNKRIGEWRGMWWKEVAGDESYRYFLATYHPAAVLRNPSLTTPTRADIESFAFYSLGHFDPPIGEVQEGKRKKYWQQERLI